MPDKTYLLALLDSLLAVMIDDIRFHPECTSNDIKSEEVP